MRTRVTAAAIAWCLSVLGSACAASPEPASAPAARRPTGYLFVTATATGAVLLDRGSDTYVGIDRDGRRVWTEADAYARGASVVCAGRCPDAVVSGAAGPSEPAPVLYSGGTRTPFVVPEASRRTVLTARSADDAVVAGTGVDGTTVLHLLRPGADERIPLAGDVGWFENPAGTAALLLPRRVPGSTTVRWFERDGTGWRATGSGFPATELRDACVARDGRTALLAGPRPLVILDRTRAVPLRTDLPVVSECGLGERGGAVLARSFSPDGHRTDVRGIGVDGVVAWSRGYDTEAAMATDPAGEWTAIAHDGVLEVLDRTGRVVRTEAGVTGVRFTAEGELVVVAPDGAVRWLSGM